MVIILYAAFQYNIFNAADNRSFHNKSPDQSYVINRIIKNRHVGFETTLIWRKGMWSGNYTQAIESTYQDYFLDRKPTMGSWYYSQSAGLQGWFYTLIDAALRVLDLSGRERLEYMRKLTSLAFAIVLSALLVLIAAEFGIIGAALSLIAIIASPFLTFIAGDIYYMIFLGFLSILWCCRYYVSRDPPEGRDLVIFSIGFSILAFLNMLAGFDYISPVLASAAAVVVYGASKHGFVWPRIFRHGGLVSANILITFAAAFLTTFSLNLYILDHSFEDMKEWWIGKITEKTYGGGGNADQFIGVSDASVWDVVAIYLTDSISGIPLVFIFSFLLLSGLAFLLIIAFQDGNWRSRFWVNSLWQKSAALYLFGILSFLAPISKFVINTSHAYGHHVGAVFWSVPGLLFLLPAIWAMARLVRSTRLAIGMVIFCFIIASGAASFTNKWVDIHTPNVLKHKASFFASLEKINNKTLKPAIKSPVRVYIDLDEGRLVYISRSEICWNHAKHRFFIHVMPEDPNVLKQRNIKGDMEIFNALPSQMDYIVRNRFRKNRLKRRCIFFWKLPDYKIKTIRTGQFIERKNVSPEKRWHNFWEGWADVE